MKNITKATVKSIISRGGATFNKNGERVTLKSGYQVSKKDLIVLPVTQMNKFIIKELLKRIIMRGEYLGVWINEGLAYIDISYRTRTKKEALRMGKEYNQISVLRWKDGSCIMVEG